MEVQWYLTDDNGIKSDTPYYTYIDEDDLEMCESDEERKELIHDKVKDDFNLVIGIEIS